MKKALKTILLLILVSNTFAQISEKNSKLIDALEGEWLFIHSKGPWGTSTSKDNGFEEVINFTRNTADSLTVTIYVDDTLFYERKHQFFVEEQDDHHFIYLVNKNSANERIEIVSDNTMRRTWTSFYQNIPTYLEYKRIDSDIVDNTIEEQNYYVFLKE